MTNSKITPACLFVDTFYCPFMPLDQNSKHSFWWNIAKVQLCPPGSSNLFSSPTSWFKSPSLILPLGFMCIFHQDQRMFRVGVFWRLFCSWPFDIGAAPSTGGDPLNHEPEYLPRSRFFKDFEMEPNALRSKGWHFWEKKAIMKFSTLEVDFSANFHLIHIFLVEAFLTPRKLEKKIK